MNMNSRKKEHNKKLIGKSNIIIPCIVWLCFIGVMIGVYVNVTDAFDTSYTDEPVRITFPELENDADCALIQQGDKAILIDTGESTDADTILNMLEEQEVQSIEYMIITHPDADHIGSAEVIISQYQVLTVILPYYSKENTNLESLQSYLDEQNINVIYPTRTRRFSVGTMSVLVYPPLEKYYSNDNNYSLATLITHGETNILFTGDALEKRTAELEQVDWPELDLMTIPYHGRATDTSQEFLEMTSPQYGIVTSVSADSVIQETAEQLQIELFYTGQSSYTFESFGEGIYLVE